MLHWFSINAPQRRQLVRFSCAAGLLIVAAGCSPGSETDSDSIPDDINNEILRVNLDDGVAYEWRVRAITEENTGEWSDTFLVETDTLNDGLLNDEIVNVTFSEDSDLLADDLDTNEPLFDEFCDPLFNDNCNPEFNPALADPLFGDDTVQSTPDFTGIPKFSWPQVENALGYEIELYERDTFDRVGIYQYAESSVCIEGSCELVLQNDSAALVDIPYIALISHTAIQDEAPYQAELSSPVLDTDNLSSYSHLWSIEGSFEEFPDTPEFSYTFEEAGFYTVNVLVTSAAGRSEYAYATVEVFEPTVTASTDTSAEASVDEEDNTPDVSAALPVQTEVSTDTSVEASVNEEENEPAESAILPVQVVESTGSDTVLVPLAAPEVSVSDKDQPAAVLPVTGSDEDNEGATTEQTAAEQPVAVVQPEAEQSTGEQPTASSPVVVLAPAEGQGETQQSTNEQSVEAQSGVTATPVDTTVEFQAAELISHNDGDVLEAGDITFELDLKGVSYDDVAYRVGSTSSDNSEEYGSVKTFLDSWTGGIPTSITATNLPQNGSDVYLKMEFKLDGVWTPENTINAVFEAYTDPSAPPVVVSQVDTAGWDNSLPNGGRALGVVTSGISTGNAALVKHKSARRFMATRSGQVKSFGYLNRTLTAGDISSRAVSRKTSEPIWYKVQQAVGNDPKRGGYMLSSSYSVGNGGLQEVTLQTDDGSPEHFPSGTIVARAKPFIPFDLALNKWVIIDFETTGTIEAGQIYHLVYENLNPPNTNIRALSAAEAKNAPTNAGAISLDGTTDGIAIDPEERHGPFLRNFPQTLIKKSSTAAWEATNVTSWYSIIYSDDVTVGETYAHFQGAGTFRHVVDGNNQMRQQFTWNYPTVTVDRIATRFGLNKNANGRDMSVVVKSQDFGQQATGSVPFDAELKAIAANDNVFVGRQTRHGVSSLSQPVELVNGQKYYVEYSAPSGAGFVIHRAVETARSEGNTDRNLWADASVQLSTNGGSSWETPAAFPSSDMPMYFIPVGVSTETPIP